MNKSIRSPVYQHMVAFHRCASFLVLFLGLVLGSAQAQTTNIFTGASGGLWSATNNWSLGTVPTTNDPVLINSNTTVNVQANAPN